MNRELQDAIDAWDREVASVAANMIENGTPPIEAMEMAKDAVIKIRRRRGKSRINEILGSLSREGGAER